ncbi:biopolymer transporter ExbD [Caulobacter sp. BE254]|uniref:ExbD/TolR family protein n=1 Tax=Caulobacter sp. BE254 TaxID=2817720 RepID=UPI002862CF82|nr:biopolymer transporter ExbD [Caulobacter sp. BE254]MDR7116939.1 biopolymer transport protein ExbD [Caulobacter sp. BE254]
MGWKRILGLALASVALALVVWGLFLPLTTVSIKVDLPPARPSKPVEPKAVEIFIDANGAIQVNGRPSSLDTLASDVGAVSMTRDRNQQQLMIRASETVTYGTYMAVLERLRGAGWHKVGIVKEAISN